MLKISALLFILFLNVPVLAHASVDKTEFEEILLRVKREFQPDADQRNWRIVTRIGWNKKELNAHATTGMFSQNKRIVFINGEIAQQDIRVDSMLSVICHELGHHFGGSPVYPETGLSAEGQADYWAAQICMPRLFRNQFKEQTFPISTNTTEYRLCEEKIEGENDRQICARTLQAILEYRQTSFRDFQTSFVKILEKPEELWTKGEAVFMERFFAPSLPLYSTPDLREVEHTSLTHPAFQCRVDTALAGVLNEPRPRCWFKTEK